MTPPPIDLVVCLPSRPGRSGLSFVLFSRSFRCWPARSPRELRRRPVIGDQRIQVGDQQTDNRLLAERFQLDGRYVWHPDRPARLSLVAAVILPDYQGVTAVAVAYQYVDLGLGQGQASPSTIHVEVTLDVRGQDATSVRIDLRAAQVPGRPGGR